MYRLFKISVFLLLSHFAAAQCDTTGILLELQATTNLNGLLIGDDKCIKKAVVISPLVVSNDTLYYTGGGGSATANNGVSDNEDSGKLRLGNRYMNTPDAPFTMDRKVNIAGFLFHIGDNTDSTLLTIDGVNDRVGIGTAAPQRKFQVTGEARITDLTTDTPTNIVGADGDGDLGLVSVSTGLSLSGGVLTSTITQYTDEQAQDAVGTILTDGSIIDFTYNDATPSITATVIAGAIGTTQLADDGVTYAKIQNVANNNRILGRVSGAGGNVEELTAAQVQTLISSIDGALTSPRIPYASDANTLTDNANLSWLNATQEIMVGGGASLDARFSHKATANITGDSKFSNGDNNVSGTYEMRLANTRNVSNTGNSKLTLQTGGTSAGDPFIYLNVPGGGSVSIGIDNTDGDKIKISPLAATPGANANNGLIITNTATPLVGINTDNPAHALDVSGSARAVNLRNTLAAPTVGSLGTGLGTGPTIDVVDGGNNGFIIYFTTGTAPAANGNLFRVTYANPFTTYSFPVWSADNNNAATDYGKFVRSGASPGWFDWVANGTLSASTTYQFIFNVMGL